MKNYIILLTIVLSFTALNFAYAQSETILIQGKVVDSTGAPIVGATVKLLGTYKGAKTKADGSFKILYSHIDDEIRELSIYSVSLKKVIDTINICKDEKILNLSYMLKYDKDLNINNLRIGDPIIKSLLPQIGTIRIMTCDQMMNRPYDH